MSKKIKTRTYFIHGLRVESEINLPGLVEEDVAKSDAKILEGRLTERFPATELNGATVFRRAGFAARVFGRASVLLEWEQVGKVLVQNGARVTVERHPDSTEADWQPFLTGPVMAVLLHQRGFLVLHAAAVVFRGTNEAAIFLGEKGEGKSTLAAFLHSAGHRPISDDIVAVAYRGDRAVTCPGISAIKLHNDSVKAALGENPARLPLIHRFAEKRSFAPSRDPSVFFSSPVALGAIYVLARGETVQINRLDLKEAFVETVRHSHLRRFLEALNCRREHFDQCRRLLDAVPVFELRRPHDFRDLPRVAAQLERHARRTDNRHRGRKAA